MPFIPQAEKSKEEKQQLLNTLDQIYDILQELHIELDDENDPTEPPTEPEPSTGDDDETIEEEFLLPEDTIKAVIQDCMVDNEDTVYDTIYDDIF